MEIIKQTTPRQEEPAEAPRFKGYTLDELRYQRALTALQKDFCRTKMINNVGQLRKYNPLSSSGSTSTVGKLGHIATRIASGMSYLDYAMIGFSLFSSARKVYSFFRRKKK